MEKKETQMDVMIQETRQYIMDNLTITSMSNEELEDKIEELIFEKTKDGFFSIEEKVQMVQEIYGSIRGFGILDSILSDDNVTEVMINGPDNIFIEKNGTLIKLNRKFESQRRLEDIIQRIVGLAGREVNQANPIVDTRLPDGSRVNVVLPPIALCGPTVTIRKFSKEPMTIDKLISETC